MAKAALFPTDDKDEAPAGAPALISDTQVSQELDAATAPLPATDAPAVRLGADQPGWTDSTTLKAQVKDNTARMVPGKARADCARTHACLVDGAEFNYTFPVGESVEMPLDHALKFLRIPEFDVLVNGKKIIRPADIRDLTGPIDAAKLPHTQTIADLDELTADALIVRCKMLPGGEAMSIRLGKATLVRFLVDARKATEAQIRREAGGIENDPDMADMSEAELEKLTALEAA